MISKDLKSNIFLCGLFFILFSLSLIWVFHSNDDYNKTQNNNTPNASAATVSLLFGIILCIVFGFFMIGFVYEIVVES